MLGCLRLWWPIHPSDDVFPDTPYSKLAGAIEGRRYLVLSISVVQDLYIFYKLLIAFKLIDQNSRLSRRSSLPVFAWYKGHFGDLRLTFLPPDYNVEVCSSFVESILDISHCNILP
jgi:hypothetical protein